MASTIKQQPRIKRGHNLALTLLILQPTKKVRRLTRLSRCPLGPKRQDRWKMEAIESVRTHDGARDPKIEGLIYTKYYTD